MWTLKEAFAKCTGAGVTMDFERMETSLEPLNVVARGHDGAEAPYWVHQEQWHLGAQAQWVAVAARHKPPSEPAARPPVRQRVLLVLSSSAAGSAAGASFAPLWPTQAGHTLVHVAVAACIGQVVGALLGLRLSKRTP